MADTVRVVANLTTNIGKEDDAFGVLEALLVPTRSEPGCLFYELYRDLEHPTKATLLEEWETKEQYFAHLNSDHVLKAFRRAEELLADRIDVQQLNLLGAPQKIERSKDRSQVLTVVATLEAKSGKEADLRTHLEGLIEPTRAESGCIRYELHEDIEIPRNYVFLEEWEDAKDLTAHLESPHMQAWRSLSEGILSREPDLKKLQLVG